MQNKESFVKTTTIVLLIGTILSFVSTFLVFHNNWTLVSYPTVIFVVLIGLIVTYAFVQSKQINYASWALMVVVILALIGAVTVDGYTYYAAPSIIFIIILLSMALLPRKFIIPLNILCVVILFVIANLQYPVLSLANPLIDSPLIILTRNSTSTIGAIIGWMIMKERK